MPEFGQCPWQVIPISVPELPIQLANGCFHPLTHGYFWQRDCEYILRASNCSRGEGMLGELVNIPTDTLIDMLYIVLSGDLAITANEVEEVEQIQRELQRRGAEQRWCYQAVN